MKVRSKIEGRIGGTLPGGALWYRDVTVGEKLDLPEQFFNETQFKSLEKPKKDDEEKAAE